MDRKDRVYLWLFGLIIAVTLGIVAYSLLASDTPPTAIVTVSDVAPEAKSPPPPNADHADKPGEFQCNWSVTVRSRRGRPLVAEVLLTRAGNPQVNRMTTDHDGIAEFSDLLPGQYKLVVRAPEHMPYETSHLTLAAGKHHRDIVLEPSRVVTGNILDPQGQPVGDGQVQFHYNGGKVSWQTADGAGHFEWTMPEGDLQPPMATAIAPHFANSATTAVVVGQPLLLRMAPGGMLEVEVVDSQAVPLPNIAVSLMADRSDPAPFPKMIGPLTTDGAGKVTFGPLRPLHYAVQVQVPNRAPVGPDAVQLVGGQTEHVRVEIGGSKAILRGRITSRDGNRPIARATVSTDQPSGSGLLAVVTDADGQYEIKGVPAGRHALNVVAEGYTTEMLSGIEVPPDGEVRKDVQLDSAQTGGRLALQGIGAQLRKDGRGLVVDGLVDDSPAGKYGLQKGDVIVAVDKDPVGDKPMAEVVSHIRGDAGSTVVLEIERNGQKMTIPVTRDRVKVK